MPEDHEAPGRLVDQIRDEKFTLSVYEQADRTGRMKRFWTLTREAPEGQKPLVIGGTMDELAKARELIVEAEQLLGRGRDAEPPRQDVSEGGLFAVVRFEKLKVGGAVARVIGTYTEQERHLAEAFVERRSEYALLPHALQERVQKGDVIFIPSGMSKATDRHISELEWQESNGRRFTWGLWCDRESAPREGQLVTIDTGREPIRGEPEARKVVPLGRTLERGEPENPFCVVVERHERLVGRSRVVAVHHNPETAAQEAKGLELREKVLGPQWNTMTFNP